MLTESNLRVMESIGQWSLRAKCRGYYGRLTKEYCETGCPVVGECYAYALVHGERGWWGGTSEKERSPLTLGPAIQTLREMYRAQGLLETRFPVDLSISQVLGEELLPEQSYPTFPEAAC
jgi:hypothetical protein